MQATGKPPLAAKHRSRWRNYHFGWLDWLLVGVMGLVVAWLYHRATVGIHYEWHWAQAWALVTAPSRDGGLPYFVVGIIATLRLSLWSMLSALVLGTALGLARSSQLAWLRLPALAYIQLVRNIPALVFIFIFYFFVANQLIPLLGLEPLLREHSGEINALQAALFGPAALWENLLSGVLCLSMLSSAYIAEIVRAGLQNVPQGQWQAAYALGLSKPQTLCYVIAPQVLMSITPMLAGQAISLIKDSSIISLISIQELTFVGSEIANSSGLIFEIWLLVGASYFVLCYGLALLFSQLERYVMKGKMRIS